ncbi:MAG: gamma-glutamyltransferase [candidate division KSB1 bacterium]|jgi:gamma-glutamyltranspeptidase/glutathione hydrolase|nr:gamma-glutamyltransferase [candidate division KSB1 bacterium]
MRISFNILFIALLGILLLISASDAYADKQQGMIVTAHPLASEAGLSVLRDGGNAVDAAVVSALVLGIVEPYASGLGGGGGMLIYLHDADSLTYVNYYPCAPRLVPTDFNREKEARSALAALVPGTVAGLHHALSHYGTMTWDQLLHRIIKRFKDGFEVDLNLNKNIFDAYESLLVNKQTREIYLVDDFPPETGDKLNNQRLMRTLTLLADGGPDLFYHGEIADSIDAFMIEQGGGLRKSDLEAYRVREFKPVRGTYRGRNIVSAPPPQSGMTLIEILNIFETRALPQAPHYTEDTTILHFMAEANKLAYADRRKYLSDKKYMDVPLDILISKPFAELRAREIDMKKAIQSDAMDIPAGDIGPFKTPELIKSDHHGSTTHISVCDGSGNAVSLTQTLNFFWGCSHSVCGFLLNNGMTSFSNFNPANATLSGRQPRSTIAPSLIFKDNSLTGVIGTPGSGRILSTMATVISNLIDHDYDADSANRAPRFANLNWTRKLKMENRFSPQLIAALEELGHDIDTLSDFDLYFGGVQLILIDPENGHLTGSTDPRRAGIALGY